MVPSAARFPSGAAARAVAGEEWAPCTGGCGSSLAGSASYFPFAMFASGVALGRVRGHSRHLVRMALAIGIAFGSLSYVLTAWVEPELHHAYLTTLAPATAERIRFGPQTPARNPAKPPFRGGQPTRGVRHVSRRSAPAATQCAPVGPSSTCGLGRLRPDKPAARHAGRPGDRTPPPTFPPQRANRHRCPRRHCVLRVCGTRLPNPAPSCGTARCALES